MRRSLRTVLLTVAWLCAAAMMLSGCAGHSGSWPGPGAPRNGAGVLVDPVYGTSLPGGPPEF
ncbi:MAG TPA: hypothetical protein VLX85_14170 [Stellaceae bacterium]|nr:hypothetical protein [Stellaceae bacterium]